VLALVILMFVAFSLLLPRFLDGRNLTNLLTSVAILLIVSLGMTFVTILGGFDLSIGAVAALSAVALGKMITSGVPAWVAVLVCIVAGGVVGGAVNGVLIGKLRLSFFVVTLATMTAYTGFVLIWSNTETINVADPFIRWLGVQSTLGVPTPIWIMVLLFAVFLYVQTRTYFGRDIYAVGGSYTAARLSGIRTVRTTIMVYAIVGACAAVGGIILVGRIGASSPQVNAELPLQAAAAVLLGGTALAGGAGGVGGTVLGVLFIGILQNGLSLAGVQSFWQQVVTGVILVAAVLGDRVFTWRRGTARVAKPRRPVADVPRDESTASKARV
jgi:ribose/xylose/arabinose/galactoside ABC-type transport system permease subunit